MSIYGNLLSENVRLAIEESKLEILDEGIIQKLKNLFSKKSDKKDKKPESTTKYTVVSKDRYNVGAVETFLSMCVSNSVKEAIEHHVTILSGEYKDNQILLYSSKFDKIKNNEIDIIKLEILSQEEKKYHKEYKCKVSEISESGKVIEILDRCKVSYKINNTGATEKYRRQLFKTLQSIAKEALSKTEKDGLSTKGFSVNDGKETDTYGETENSEFFIGLENYISIIDCDAWEFTNNKARDDEEYSKYMESFYKIYKYLDQGIKAKSIKGKLDYYGDWDDGPIVFEIDE